MTDATKMTKDDGAKYNQYVLNEQMSTVTKVTKKTNSFMSDLYMKKVTIKSRTRARLTIPITVIEDRRFCESIRCKNGVA